MNREPKIQFVKWDDPYGADIDKRDLPNLTSENEEGEEETLNLSEIMEQQKPVKVIMTAMGMIPITEHTSPSKNFNFWCGHSNFHVTKKISELISKVDGVEAYQAFSPYRFRIAVARLFEEKDVMDQIKKEVYIFLER